MQAHYKDPGLPREHSTPMPLNSASGHVAYSLADRPTLRFKELLQVISVGRSQAYVLMKTDPDFPKGVPLYDSENSPKFYWTHEAIGWLQGRVAKARAMKEGRWL